MGPPEKSSYQDLESLAGQVRRLLEPWAPEPGSGGDTLELSAPELLALIEQADGLRLELAARVKGARALRREAALSPDPELELTPLQKEEARLKAERQLEQVLERLAQTRHELELLRQVAELYPELLALARGRLAEILPVDPPPAQESLEQAWRFHREARRAQGRCARLNGLARRIRAARLGLAERAQELGQQARDLNQDIAAQSQRLAELEQEGPSRPGAPEGESELDLLSRELNQSAAPAAVLQSRLERLELSRQRQGQRLLKITKAWHACRDQWAEHASQRSRVARRALALAQERAQAATELGGALRRLREALGPLRLAELEPELELVATRTRGLAQAAQQELAQARRLRQGDQPPSPPGGRDDEPSPAAAPSERVDQAALAELGRKVDQAAQARRLGAQRRQAEQARFWQDKANAWAAQLRRVREEARRLGRLADRHKANEETARRQGREEAEALQQEVGTLTRRVEQLNRQLASLALLVSLLPAAPRATLVRLHPKKLQGALGRLAQAGKKTPGFWALLLGLAAGLVLALPGMPAKATLSGNIPRVSASRLAASPLAETSEARLEVRLVPLGERIMPMALLEDPQFSQISQRAGLSPYALYFSARAAHPGAAAVALDDLDRLAAQARVLAQRHPVIFADLAHGGLPPAFSQLVASEPAGAPATSRFADRLYRDYRRVGFSRAQALGAVAASQSGAARLVREQRLPQRFWGRVRPIQRLEKMEQGEFLARLSPYIAERCRRFLIMLGRRPPADLERYASDLALDMYCAAKKFAVPVSYLLTIAHQETFYANVLGDDDLSASPFQIWRPTLPFILRSMREAGFVPPPERIRLQHHLTIATELAAYHLRGLMLEAVVTPSSRGLPRYVNMDQVMRRYNGSTLYAPRVAVRRAELARFLARRGG